jgi:ribonucleoside-triphosphate reductase
MPKDIADMHLAGEINIAPTSVWGLVPDTVFLDLGELEQGLDLRGHFLNVARVPMIKTAEDATGALPLLISLLSREASSEVVIEGIIPAFVKNMKDSDELASRFARALVASSAAPSYSPESPTVTIAVPADALESKQLNSLIDGYRKYVDATPVPRIGLALTTTSSTNSGGKSSSAIRDSIDHVAAAVRSGGIISICSGQLRASNGIRKSEAAGKASAAATVALHSLSINLPRLAYESNKDETYFRAKLALMIKPSLAAMFMRRKTIVDNIKRGLTPAIENCSISMQRGASNVVINLVGARESVYNILGHEGAGAADVMQKVLKTSGDVVAAQARQLSGGGGSGSNNNGGESAAGISMVADGSGMRFATIDSEKYGKVSLLQSQNTTSYSQGMTIGGKDLLLPDKASALIQECIAVDRLLNGGFAASIDVTDLAPSDIRSALEAASEELAFFRPKVGLGICTTCGRKSRTASDRCDICKSSHKLLVYS